MKRVIVSLFVFVLLIVCGLVLFKEKNYPDDENTLYSIRFNNIKLRFERYDYSLGQNQMVGVEKSINKGKNFDKVTDELLIVSMDAKFVFINEKLGFAVSKKDLNKSNNYSGIKVTDDGGKTFIDATINYNNPDIELISVLDVPYLEKDLLKLDCSIYQVKEDKTGYEDKKITFVSIDSGKTWNLELNDKDRYLEIKNDVNKEIERYIYVVFPKCKKGKIDTTNTIELLDNAGFDKEKLLDVDYKSYCSVYVYAQCVEDGKWEWETNLKCKNYVDKNYKNHLDEK